MANDDEITMPKPTPEVAFRLVNTPMILGFDLLSWQVIHGALLLAYQHPETRGPGRMIAVRLIEEIARRLLLADPIFRQVFVAEEKNMREAGHSDLALALETALAEGT